MIDRSLTLSRAIPPALVLLLFAAIFPLRLPGMSESSGDQCATLADVGGPRNRAPLDLLERCTRLYPDDAELAGDLALSLEDRSDPRAAAAYRRALSIDPSHADLRLRLGQLLLRQGDAAGAAAEAQAGLRVQPNRRALVDLLQSARNLVTGDGL